MRRAFLACLFSLLACGALAQAPEKKAHRILFVGNGLTSVGDIPARLEKLARVMGRKATVESVVSNDYSLEDHLRDGRALEAIRKGWDVVVLQQGAATQDPGTQLVESSRRFAKAIRDAGGKPAIFMTWPTDKRPGDFKQVIGTARDAAAAVDGLLLPVGEAWLRTMSADKRVRLYSGAVQPSSMGSDLAVLTIYLVLFPAGQYEFDDAFIAKIADTLEIAKERREMLFDAATRAIDEPMALK